MLFQNLIIGETIIIDDGIKIIVMDIQGEQIRFGIDAPKEVKVYREEIYKRMQAEADSGKDVA